MKVLIVDDSTFSRVTVANILKKADETLEVVYANDGAEGITQYVKEKPDFALIDLMMPHVSGAQLVTLIREYDASARVIVLSADIQRGVQEEALESGAIGFIEKPLNAEKAERILALARGESDGSR